MTVKIMNLKKIFAIKNACYIAGVMQTPKGIMVHSTGANNPNLWRYVQPIGYTPEIPLLGVNKNKNDWCNNYLAENKQMCVNAFIGRLTDGSIATYQTLPWDMKSWHSGTGALGAAKNANNNGYIGFEICEDGLADREYFGKSYKEAAELCAFLCKKFDISHVSPQLICHAEGHKLGIASNHGDVLHWWSKFGVTMDDFRADVKKLIGCDSPAAIPEADKKEPDKTPENVKNVPFTIRVKAGTPIYKTPPEINDMVDKAGVYTVIDTRDCADGKRYGLLKTPGVGWIQI
jgi:hypothetical protein